MEIADRRGVVRAFRIGIDRERLECVSLLVSATLIKES
jgi:hypothetical protein